MPDKIPCQHEARRLMAQIGPIQAMSSPRKPSLGTGLTETTILGRNRSAPPNPDGRPDRALDAG
jgi:hypothetical protein